MILGQKLTTNVIRMRRMCLGLFEDQGDQDGREYLLCQTPIPRRISKRCLGNLPERDEEGSHSCKECLKLHVIEEAVIEVRGILLFGKCYPILIGKLDT